MPPMLRRVAVLCRINMFCLRLYIEGLGRILVLKARVNIDLHMAGELYKIGRRNLSSSSPTRALRRWMSRPVGPRAAATA